MRTRLVSCFARCSNENASAWTLLFGSAAPPTWTAAALTEFKDLADKLREGTLSWVLRTGLPLTGDFSVYLNGKKLAPAKADWTRIVTLPVGGDDAEAKKLGICATERAIEIPGIGAVLGEARLYERQLAGGKSDQYNRSRGFFVRVRKRVINLEDELFGLDVLNHAAWAHFMMEIEADGLRHYLLSSREGVREAQPVRLLREYLREKFNACRRKFDAVRLQQLVGLDIQQLLSDAPSVLVTQPLLEALQTEMEGEGRQLYYIRAPAEIEGDAAREWLDDFESAVSTRPFDDLEVAKGGAYAPLAEYDAANRRVIINEDHPFIVKLRAHSKNQTPITLFATSEILTDAMVRRFGLDPSAALALFEMRDRVLRLLAGEHAPVAADAMRWLEIADQDDTAMERAVGAAFEIIGFQHEKRGGYAPGTDGVSLLTWGARAATSPITRSSSMRRPPTALAFPQGRSTSQPSIDFRLKKAPSLPLSLGKRSRARKIPPARSTKKPIRRRYQFSAPEISSDL